MDGFTFQSINMVRRGVRPWMGLLFKASTWSDEASDHGWVYFSKYQHDQTRRQTMDGFNIRHSRFTTHYSRFTTLDSPLTTHHLHPLHIPVQFFFHFFITENRSDYFLQAHECRFAFNHIIVCPVVHTINGHIYFILR